MKKVMPALMHTARFVLMPILLMLGACTSNPNYDSSKPHHTPSGFRNLHIDDSAKGFAAFAKWKWEQFNEGRPDARDYHFPIVQTGHDAIRGNRDRPSLTWIGHATFLIQLGGLNILTDPQFSERASPVSWAGPRRVVEPAMSISELPEIDVVVLSHDHYDSLDVASINALVARKQQRVMHFIVPLGLKAWFEDLGIHGTRVTELDWGQQVSLSNVQFTAEPVQHWGKRTLFDAFTRLWASWVIESDKLRLYFAGDSGYVRHFREIGQKYGSMDVALLPIGAYAPRWFMKSYHVNPDEAVRVHQDLNARYSVAMHWGTFMLTDEPLDEPPVKLAAALEARGVPASQFEVYQHGETRFLDEVLK